MEKPQLANEIYKLLKLYLHKYTDDERMEMLTVSQRIAAPVYFSALMRLPVYNKISASSRDALLMFACGRHEVYEDRVEKGVVEIRTLTEQQSALHKICRFLAEDVDTGRCFAIETPEILSVITQIWEMATRGEL